MEQVRVAIIGGGQAGLATGRELAERGVEHCVFERSRVGQSWRDRWDSFCLVTPNWTLQLPGAEWHGDDPDGYLSRDGTVAYLERYAQGLGDVREGVDVRTVRELDGGFVLDTTTGGVLAESLVVATGAYQRPFRTAAGAVAPGHLASMDVTGYTNEAALPAGAVLVVGSGQSGCQIAEELCDAGREVVLSCGKAPWAPRRFAGRDMFSWAVDARYLDQRVEDLPDPRMRFAANILGTGREGGHDLHYRTLQAKGVTLAGHLARFDGNLAHFAPDLADSVAWGDERYWFFMDLIVRTAASQRVAIPDIPDPAAFDAAAAPDQVDLSRFGAVIFAGGFRPDYSWLPWPQAFDADGFPVHRDGSSTVVSNLYFVGVHFLRTRKSSLLLGVGEDAALVAAAIAGRGKRSV